MKFKKIKVLVLSVIAMNSFNLVAFASPVNKTSEYDFNVKLEDLSLDEQIQIIDNKITENLTSSNELELKIKEAEKQIKSKQEELYNLQKKHLLRKKQLSNSTKMLKTSEDNQSAVQTINTLLNSNSVSDFFKKIELKKITNPMQINSNEVFYNQENSLINIQDDLNKQIDNLKQDKLKLEEHKTDLDKLKKEIENKILAESLTQPPIVRGGVVKAPDITTEASPKAKEIIAEAFKYLGVPYVWGGTTPNGFDCSGFTQYVFNKFGINIPRVSQSQQLFGKKVPISEAQPGDLLFNGYPAHHVSIYIGNGQYIHAPRTGDVIKISTVNWSRISSVSRVI